MSGIGRTRSFEAGTVTGSRATADSIVLSRRVALEDTICETAGRRKFRACGLCEPWRGVDAEGGRGLCEPWTSTLRSKWRRDSGKLPATSHKSSGVRKSACT